jgi:hypothetical protein
MHRYATPNSDAAVMASIPNHTFCPSDLFLVSVESNKIYTSREQGEPKKS